MTAKKPKFNMDEFVGKALVKAIKKKKIDVDISSLIEVPIICLDKLDEKLLKKTNDAKRQVYYQKEDEEALFAAADHQGWTGTGFPVTPEDKYVDKDLVDGVVVVKGKK
ncbi:MAG: hypothetical protein QQN63_12800 [Nitrosopumilus sp.]